NSTILAKSYIGGFSTVILWSPYIAAVALVLLYLDIPVSDYITVGIILAVIQLVIGNILFWLWTKWETNIDEMTISPVIHENDGQYKKEILSLFITLVLLMALLFLMEFMTGWPMMFLVCLLSLS